MSTRCIARRSAPGKLRLGFAAALALALGPAAACSGPARSFGATPAAARSNADGLFDAFRIRFGPHERDAELRAVRPRLLKHFLTPAAIHRDDLLWSSASDSTRTLAVAGKAGADGFVLAKRRSVARPARPGESRHIMRLVHIEGDVYEWDATDELAIGSIGAQELYTIATGALEAIEDRTSAELRAGVPIIWRRSAAALGRLFTIDSLAAEPSDGGSAAITLIARMEPDRMREDSPALAEYLASYFSSAHYEIVVEDREEPAVPWLLVRIADERIELRWRTRDGRLQPLEGPGREAPETFRIRIAASMKVLLFRVGVSDLEGELRVIDEPDARGWEIRFREEPEWHFPLATEHLLGAPLSRPFEGDGAMLRYVVRSGGAEEAQTLVARDIRIQVQESMVLRLLNRIGNKLASDYGGAVEDEMQRYIAEVVGALHRDVVALLPPAPGVKAVSRPD